MLDIGWPELLVVAIVLIVVVGPKDLPGMLRNFANATKKMRRMAGDFRSQFDDALKEAELDDVKDLVNTARDLNPANHLKSALDPLNGQQPKIRSHRQWRRRWHRPPSSAAPHPPPAVYSLPSDSAHLNGSSITPSGHSSRLYLREAGQGRARGVGASRAGFACARPYAAVRPRVARNRWPSDEGAVSCKETAATGTVGRTNWRRR